MAETETNTTMTTIQTENLTSALHDLNMSCGEIITGKDAAQFIQEFEFENSVEFTNEQILKAMRDAGERFVESMQENEYDTEDCVHDGLYGGHPIDALEVRLARWEVQRPSVIRRKALAALLTEHQPTNTTTPLTINDWTLGSFTAYLESSIIPDSIESGHEGYAEDLQTALDFIRALKSA